ncbi:ankyrin repeat-containing protein [Paecilomyces lecythidis]
MPMSQHKAPIALSFEAIDDLIYDARSGDLDALKTDVENLSKEHGCSAAAIIESAVDTEDESEGGTGACLLHWPAANGNIEILSYLLTTLSSTSTPSSIINHRNHSGNTPLHWAALNTHLECVKALVEAGADLDTKNDTGHDAVFLAERTAWSTEEKGGEEQENEEDEAEAQAETEEGKGNGMRKISKGQEVVEWLLGSEKGAGLESGVGAEGEGESSGNSASKGEEMEGVEKTNA